jgi:parallel beta-helix repeat protein
MTPKIISILILSIFSGIANADTKLESQVYTISPNTDIIRQIQERIIDCVPGDIIQFEEGKYQLPRQIDIAVAGITIRGRGPDKTILSFKGQIDGGQGIEATGNDFLLESLAIEDTAGNAIKVLGAKNVVFRDVRIEWTGPPSHDNGAYGLYPVQCENVLIERCNVYGASDAGVYVGQSNGVVVRNCRAERNVAGIEIENTSSAEVYDNVATNNTGGLLVFDLPGLQIKKGKDIRVYNNEVIDNNHFNFADEGSVVAAVPQGTGIMVLATDYVEIFDNTIDNHQTANVLLVSYIALGKKIKDNTYDPIPEYISVHDNRITRGGYDPQGEIAKILKVAIGRKFPDILWDGIVNENTSSSNLSLKNNGKATFGNFSLNKINLVNLLTGLYQYKTDIKTHSGDIPPLPAVALSLPFTINKDIPAAVKFYRSMPRKLSEYGLFYGDISNQIPAEGTIRYELNMSLFSDYADKRRFIKLPQNTQMEYDGEGLLQFPVGAIIAKTFSYGERLLETRIETKTDNGWFGASYRWNDEQNDAQLTLGGAEFDVKWIHNDGQVRTTHYEIPNANQCLNCHAQNKQYQPIGPTARNLNSPIPHGEAGYSKEIIDQLRGEMRNIVENSQLAYFAYAGILKGLPDGAMGVVNVGTVAKLYEHNSALEWLNMNCSHCHNPNGTARTTGLDLSWNQNDLSKLGVWKSPVAAGHGAGGRKYDIVPSKPDESVLMYRIESHDQSIMMPNVGRTLVHDEAVAVVRNWIEKLPTNERHTDTQ